MLNQSIQPFELEKHSSENSRKNELCAAEERLIDSTIAAVSALQEWRPGKTSPSRPIAQVIDMFSGCGGMSLGFSAVSQLSGTFKMSGAVDVNGVSLGTYANNFGTKALNRNVKALGSDEGVLERFLEEIDYSNDLPLVLIGCAPCQGFSSHRKKNWDEEDIRNSLVVDFAKVVVKLRPECVVMENVPELLSGKYWPFFEAFKQILETDGYIVKQSIHNSAAFGVPQERFRALVMAMRSDFSMPVPFLGADQFLSVREAIGSLPSVEAGMTHPTDPFHKSARHRASTIEVIRSVAHDGGSRPVGVGPKCLDRVKGFSDVYGRLYWDRPAITITHYARNPASGRFTHPEQDRGLTMREAARLQGFPDRFKFCGPFDDVFRQIGEAVPPPLAAAVAATVACNFQNPTELGGVGDAHLVHSPVNNSYSSVIAGMKMKR